MNSLIQHLKYALRQMRRSPGFSMTVILTLALGVGANAAVFTLFSQVLLRMLPVQNPQQLVRLEWTGGFSGNLWMFGGDPHDFFSYPTFRDVATRNQAFSGAFAADRANIGVSWNNQSEYADAEVLSGAAFETLGLKPALGRLFSPADDTAPGADPVAILTHAYWKARFAGSPSVIGQTVRLNGHPFTIIGVSPEGFESAIGGYKPKLFVPMSMCDVVIPGRANLHNLSNRSSAWLTIIARLRPGVSAAAAQGSLQPMWHALRKQELAGYTHYTASFAKKFVDQSTLQVKDDSRGFAPERIGLQLPLTILLAMAGLLIVMCAINVATLILLRSTARAKELAMRYALGATRGRIVRQLLLEGGLLGAFGTGVGLAMAQPLARALAWLLVSHDPTADPYSTTLNAEVLLYTLGIAFCATLAFSAAPVFRSGARADIALSLRQNTGTASRGTRRLRQAAVGVQILLSVVLLSSAGLFVHTLGNLLHQPVGFNTAHLLTFDLDPTSSGYGETQSLAVIARALDTLRALPGVANVSITSDPDLSNANIMSDFVVQGHKTVEGENRNFEAPSVAPGYFATVQQPLLAGREFTAADAAGAPPVAIVNLDFAQKFFGSARNAVGRLVSQDTDKPRFETTIVGVVGNVRHVDLRTDIGPAVYQPFAQQPHPGAGTVVLRTAALPQQLAPSVRAAIHQLDPLLIVQDLRTMDAQVAASSSNEEAMAVLAAGFSGLALLLSAVGLYGVLAYSTEQRTREIGVRLALGETRTGVMLVVVREMFWISLVAVAFAVPSVIALGRLFASQLYGMTPSDPAALGGATLLTAITVLLAAALPARRAASVPPVVALRAE